MIARRKLLTAFGMAFLAPMAPRAQQPGKVWRIGFLQPGARPANGSIPAPLRASLEELGYIQGKNVVYEGRWAEGNAARLAELAFELARLRVDAIIVLGYPAAEAAKKATSSIPVVIVGAGDAVGSGLVASLARPGGNLTGTSTQEGELSAKRLQILKETIPKAARIAVLWNANDRAMTLRYREIGRAAQVLNVAVQPLGVGAPDDFDVAFSAITREKPDALFLVADSLTALNRKRVIDFVAKHRIPAMYEHEPVVREGGLMSYGPTEDRFRRAAYYVDRIFKGATPGELPMEQPTKFELAVNLKTAAALGITIPQSVLLRADKIIQ